jgi:hypothetical protein
MVLSTNAFRCALSILRYNSIVLDLRKPAAMEAEQLNAITHSLQDLRERADELRRYL